MQTLYPLIKNNVKHIVSSHIVTSSNKNHDVVLNILLSARKESNKKTPKAPKHYDGTQFKLNSIADLKIPYNPGKEIKVLSMTDLLSLYNVQPESHVKSELVNTIAEDIVSGKCLIDYLVVERKDLHILKVFTRKFNKIGIMPSLEEGTIVENHEEFLKIKQKLISSNIARIHKYHRIVSIKIGHVKMSVHELEENLNCVLEWLLKNHAKKEFAKLFLSTFNSNSEIVL